MRSILAIVILTSLGGCTASVHTPPEPPPDVCTPRGGTTMPGAFACRLLASSAGETDGCSDPHTCAESALWVSCGVECPFVGNEPVDVEVVSRCAGLMETMTQCIELDVLLAECECASARR